MLRFPVDCTRVVIARLTKQGAATIACWVLLTFSSAGFAQTIHSLDTVELSREPLDNARAFPSMDILGFNTSIIGAGSLALLGGYDPDDWSGMLQAWVLDANGEPVRRLWDAAAILTDRTPPDGRIIFTSVLNGQGTTEGAAFDLSADFDVAELKGVMPISLAYVAHGTLAERIDYLRGIRNAEMSGAMRKRNSLLGAIIHAQSLYVAAPNGHYPNEWVTKIAGKTVPAPEMAANAQTYAQFVSMNVSRSPIIYIGANDGMLHAIRAPVPSCQSSGQAIKCVTTEDAGTEMWSYVPRAVYDNLGALIRANDFHFSPTVDATPVMRDVFFSEQGDHTWHSLLVGGLRLGGRGVYALDITDPSANGVFPQHTVLWEFDADMPAGTSEAGDDYRPTDMGYTYAQPAIARLANGTWAVLVASGYFPDCGKPDHPIHCREAGGTPPAGYSALFVIDAQTGRVIRELKTPTDIDGVTSHGLSTPVLGDYTGDYVDDVAFAGDLCGNLWRFDLSSPDPMDWKVTLSYRPAVAGAQPITVMPRLFPDPATNRFMVVFGTGKYLGQSDLDNDAVAVQSVIGLRDLLDSNGSPLTISTDALQVQTLTQTTMQDTGSAYDGTVLRSVSSHALPAEAGGWRIDLNVEHGERVVITPTALFNSNTVLVSTLIPKGPTSPPSGALMAVNAATGGPGGALASVGGVSYSGAALSQSVSSGTLPMVTLAGGGKLLFPGLKFKGKSKMPAVPLSLESPLWRRRSWTVVNPNP